MPPTNILDQVIESCDDPVILRNLLRDTRSALRDVTRELAETTSQYSAADTVYCDMRRERDELRDQVWALANGWTVNKASLYDEEGVEGWRWEDPECNVYDEIGLWDELPPWPDAASKVVAASKKETE